MKTELDALQETTMHQTTLTAYRERLREIARRLQSDARSLEEEARGGSEGENAGDLSHAPFHLGDKASDELTVDLNATYLANEGQLLSEALGALERIDAGTFGKCESCGKTVAKARLDALPFARLCIDCARLSEDHRPNLDDGRPRGPSDTEQPEGEMNEGGRRERGLFAEMSNGRADRRTDEDRRGDRYASGTAGGGTAFGGLAGSNEGHGDPDAAELADAHGSSESDLEEAYEENDDEEPRSGRAGGAVGGSPVYKRGRPSE